MTSSTDVFGGPAAAVSYDSFTPTSETTTRTDPTGVTASQSDQLGRVVGVDYAPTSKPTDHFAFTYSADDDLLQTTYPTGATATRAYDVLHRVTSLQNHASGGAAIADFADAYDSSSRKTIEDTRDGQWRYRYDSMGRLERVHDPKGFVRRYRFDRNTNRVQGEVAAGLNWARGSLLFDTNAADVPVAMTDLDSGSTSVTLPFAFPFYGQNRTELFASVNGYLSVAANTKAQPDLATTAGIFPYAKNLKLPATGGIYTRRVPVSPLSPATAFLVRWKAQKPSAAANDTTHYDQFGVWLYPDGRMSFVYGQLDDGGTGARVGYSNGDGLNFANVGGLDLGQVPANAPSVQIAPHPFSVFSASSYDALDRVSPDATHVFDAAGNMTRNGASTLGYDGRNLLTSAANASSSSTFAYDGEGRQVAGVVNGVTTRLRYGAPGDSGATYETDGAGQVNVAHVAGPGGLLADYTPTAITFMFGDTHGSVVAQTDATGTVTGRFTYDEYGVGAAPGDGYGWLGTNRKKTDAGTGVVLMGARGYDPTTGRFLQVDPLEGGCSNAYAYVFGDPVNQTDLDGRGVCNNRALRKVTRFLSYYELIKAIKQGNSRKRNKAAYSNARNEVGAKVLSDLFKELGLKMFADAVTWGGLVASGVATNIESFCDKAPTVRMAPRPVGSGPNRGTPA